MLDIEVMPVAIVGAGALAGVLGGELIGMERTSDGTDATCPTVDR